MLKLLLIPFIAVLLTATEGCYTKFGEMEPAKADTVRASGTDKETCIWERDLTGYPSLHCYPSYYPRQWYMYNYSPWWYHSDRHLYNADQCPPYYYYDPNCGCCRYYLNNPDLLRPAQGGSNKGTTGGPAPAPQDSNRVTISASSHTSISIPLHGNPSPPNAASQPAAGQSSATTAQAGPDSLTMKQKNDSLAAAPGQTVQAQRDTVKVIPVKKLRRSMRGR